MDEGTITTPIERGWRTRLAVFVAVAVGAVGTVVAVGGTAPNERVVDAANPPTDYEPLVPDRILDTRFGIGAPQAPVGPDSSIDLTVVGRGGVPDNGVGSVVLNVTVTEPTASSFVTVWPTGTERPFASSLNMVAGETAPNLVIVRVGTGGKVSLYNAFGSTHLVADVMGWFPTDSNFQGAFPERTLDTREGLGAPLGKLGPDSTIELQVAGRAGVPSDGVGSVVLNVTVTEPTVGSFITVHPTGSDRPLASSLNMQPGDTRPNLVIAKLGVGGKVSLYNAFGETHLVADVMGWFEDDSVYNGEIPLRLVDTREEGGPVAGGESIVVDMSMLPDQATTAALNVTITEPTASTFATMWPSDADRPFVSNLNAVPGDTRPNLVLVKLAPDRTVSLFNAFGSSHFVVDLVGWIGPEIELDVDSSLSPIEAFLDSPDRPLARIIGEDGGVADLVGNELLLMGSIATAQEVAADWSGTVVSTIPGGGDMQPVHTIRFDMDAIDPPPITESWARLDADIGGDYAVSDDDASTLLALAVFLLAEGYAVSPNVVVEAFDYASGVLTEQRWDINGDGVFQSNETRNPFDWAYLRDGGAMDHGFTAAWQRLDAVGRLVPTVKVAVLDGGFALSNDQQNVTRLGLTPTDANVASCGGNPCPWHGTGVTDTIYATHDNGRGTAGGASPVVTEVVAIGAGRSWESYVGALGRIATGALDDVSIANISAGVPIPAILWPFTAPILEPVAAIVAALGVEIVASAGNEGKNVDAERCFIVCWEKTYWVPCELRGVTCVGGLRYGTSTHAANSNHGRENVDIWASYTVNVGPAPDRDNSERTVNGTSFSSPLVAAGVALVQAADPRLSGTAAANRLLATARAQPGEARARRVLDVQAAVEDTLRRQGRDVAVVTPADGGDYGYAQQVNFEARWCCTGSAPISYSWAERPAGSGSFVTIASGRTPTVRLTRGVGARDVRVTARWADGASRSDTVRINVTNSAPFARIDQPAGGATFFASQTIPLRATAFDTGGWGTAIPTGNLVWRIDGAVHDTGRESSVDGLAIGSHTISFTASDGNLASIDSITVNVIADPPNPPPSVTILQPTGGDFANTNSPLGYSVLGQVDASDPTDEPLTVSFYRKLGGVETFMGNGVETFAGSDIYELQLFFPWDPPGSCFDGTPWELIVRADDGTTVVSDTADITVSIIC